MGKSKSPLPSEGVYSNSAHMNSPLSGSDRRVEAQAYPTTQLIVSRHDRMRLTRTHCGWTLRHWLQLDELTDTNISRDASRLTNRALVSE
jgi:hypothetical protein